MRAITGWRFLVYIVLPMVLASLGAINLSHDLLRRVEAGSNNAEHERNRDILKEAVVTTEGELARIVTENAQWDEAVSNTTGVPNANWFVNTWGSALSLGFTYDTVALLDIETGKVLLVRSSNQSITTVDSLLGTRPFSSFRDMLNTSNSRRGVTSGFIETSNGPVVMAMAPVFSNATRAEGNGRVLYLSRNLNRAWLDTLQRQLLVGGLAIKNDGGGQRNSIVLGGPDGRSDIHLTWKDRQSVTW